MTACNLCGETSARRLFDKFGFTIVRCTGCGLERIGDMPDDAAIAAWYDEGYYTGDEERRGYLDYVKDREVMVASFDAKMERLAHYFPESPPLSDRAPQATLSPNGPGKASALPGRKRRVLDVGTAAGFFLEAAQARGWEGSGTEVSEYAWSQARQLGLEVVRGASLEPFRGQRFDLITMWDVLEHLRDPLAMLREARTLLRDDGLLVFSTGDVGNIWSRIQGKRNRIYNPPQHLYYFSRRTMTEMARRAGYDVVAVEADVKITTLHYVLHIIRNLVDLRPVAWLVGHLMRFVPNRTLRMKLSDNLVVYARPVAAKPAATEAPHPEGGRGGASPYPEGGRGGASPHIQ